MKLVHDTINLTLEEEIKRAWKASEDKTLSQECRDEWTCITLWLTELSERRRLSASCTTQEKENK